MLEKVSAQDTALIELNETLSAQLKKLQQDMFSMVKQHGLALRETIKGIEQKQETAQLEQIQALEAQRKSLELSLQNLETDLNGKAEALKSTQAQLVDLQVKQQKSAFSNRVALAAVACLALASLGWQVAQHFILI